MSRSAAPRWHAPRQAGDPLRWRRPPPVSGLVARRMAGNAAAQAPPDARLALRQSPTGRHRHRNAAVRRGRRFPDDPLHPVDHQHPLGHQRLAPCVLRFQRFSRCTSATFASSITIAPATTSARWRCASRRIAMASRSLKRVSMRSAWSVESGKNTGRSTTSSAHRSRPLAVAFRLAQD